MASSNPDAERRLQLQQLLERALDLPPQQRRPFLEKEMESTEDVSLHDEVESLLWPTENEWDERQSQTAETLSSDEADQVEHGSGGLGRRWGHL